MHQMFGMKGIMFSWETDAIGTANITHRHHLTRVTVDTAQKRLPSAVLVCDFSTI